jgi:hypothetical protein
MVRQENCAQDFGSLEFDLSLHLARIDWVRPHHWDCQQNLIAIVNLRELHSWWDNNGLFN